MWDLIDTQTIDGFEIKTYTTPEDIAPDFDDGETIEQIRNGELEWFQVKVTASKCGIELADAYLGGCCYESTKDFLGCDYWCDMAGEAMTEAQRMIEELAK